MVRDDISNSLVHLTRGNKVLDAIKNFFNILISRKLTGSSGCIKGNYKCVCFSEAPISKLATILANPSPHGMRYRPFGVMVTKKWLFQKGGRPVIYQPENEFKNLPGDLRYRHVTYNPLKNIDYSWEREWRIKADELILDPNEVTIIVPNRLWEENYRQEDFENFFKDKDLIPWHYIALEDFGVDIQTGDQ